MQVVPLFSNGKGSASVTAQSRAETLGSDLKTKRGSFQYAQTMCQHDVALSGIEIHRRT